MSNQNNYKRTVAGSVGAGMGAIFNGSGRTYYILEHKTQSQMHNIGEAQKIIIDQIEMGRASSCQVRWEDTPQFEMVSRRHAAIVKNGNNYELIHLSTSNPTFVNGQPIQGHYYLQSGDEIQLAAGGPRMGFIVPQGKQALTSSIRLTERMNLFRKQALAPYKAALWALGALLLLTIIGFGVTTYLLSDKLSEAREDLATMEQTVQEYDTQIAELMVDADKNAVKIKELENKKSQVITRYVNSAPRTVIQNDPEMMRRLHELEDLVNRPDHPDKVIIVPVDNNNDPVAPKGDARDYYGSIYRIIIENITIEGPDGISYPSNLSTSKIDCGSGFITPNGTFVTARQNIQPWIYVDGNTPADNWRRKLAVLYAMGNDIIINYSAYSTDGPAQRLLFSSRDFTMPTGGDLVTAHVTITEEEITYYESVGIAFNRKQLLSDGIDIQHTSSSARAFATLPGTERVGIPTDAGASNSIAGGTPLDIVFYNSSNVQNLAGAAEYYTANTQTTDNKGGTIRLQSGPGSRAYGAPVFIREGDGSLMVVGVYVGNNRVVPVHRFQ